MISLNIFDHYSFLNNNIAPRIRVFCEEDLSTLPSLEFTFVGICIVNHAMEKETEEGRVG